MIGKQCKAHISTAAVFLFVAVMSVFFVPTHDDLIMSACQPLGEAFRGALYYGNGRFLGNTIVRVFLCSAVWDTVIRTVCIGGTVVLSAVLAKGYNARAIGLAGIMCLGVGFPISAQVFDWGHGFYNYVPPVFLLLIVLCLLKYYDRTLKSKWMLPIVWVASFSAQLFCENSTTINLLIVAVALVWVIVKKRPKAGVITAVAGFGIGALTMFLGPTLLGVADKLSDYRSVESSLSSLLHTAIKNAFEIVTTMSTSWGLWLGLSVMILLLAQKKGKRIHWIWKTGLLGFVPVSLLLNLVSREDLRILAAVMFAVYLLCAGVILFKLSDKSTRCKIIIGLGIILASAGQLLIIYPIGPRCLYITYVLLVAGILHLLPDGVEKRKNIPLFGIIAVLSCAVYAVLLLWHVRAWNVHNVRMEYGRAQIAEGKICIEIIMLPYEKMFHCPNDSYVYPYQFNYGNLEEMRFEYITYAEYLGRMP